MNGGVFLTIATTGFAVAFLHAAIPTHWLPFVAAARVQKWTNSKTLWVTAIAGAGHVLLTTVLGILIVWLGLEIDKKVGDLFPLIAGGALILFGFYYIRKQTQGRGHGHHHLFGGHSHGNSDTHSHGSNVDIERGDYGGPLIDTGHGFVELSVFETGVPPIFRLYFYDSNKVARAASADEVVTIETIRPNGGKQAFAFEAKDIFLESTTDIPEPHEFEVVLSISHGGHAHSFCTQFTEDHHHGEHGHAGGHCDHGVSVAKAAQCGVPRVGTSDRVAILSLFALLTFSPCEGFLPVYLSGIQYGWMGFALLSVILASATLAGMVLFTWITLLGLKKLKLDFIEKYESGVLGGVLVFLGILVILFEH